ncbi:MAG: indole-3-glycerol phosphate synthase TrpC [Myxococcales bacterium]|nr:indole-3-glycerol phosphate synthase TrpC [Myxococcales bacterium]
MGGILGDILAAKREEVAASRARVSLRALAEAAREAPPPRSLAKALYRGSGPPRAIAEVKRASPSAGPIRPGADAAAIAREYASAGAAAVSVLTDARFFGGSLHDLAAVRAAVTVPALRKDFLVDDYQLVEARAAGADAVLLIVAALEGAQLAELLAAATALGMDALVEVHDAGEAELALTAGARIVGVNHRDLRTFTIDRGLTARLRSLIPPDVLLVAESGLRDAADVHALAAAGADAFLVGETLMRRPSPGDALRELLTP